MKLFRVALLLITAAFFNIILPGHQRGIITLPGSRCCCCGTTDPAHKSDPNRAAHCALCAFAATVTNDPPPDLSLPPLALVGSVKQSPSPRRATIYCQKTCQERAPPISPA